MTAINASSVYVKASTEGPSFTLFLGCPWECSITLTFEMTIDIVFGKTSDKMDHDLEIFEKKLVSILFGSGQAETRKFA